MPKHTKLVLLQYTLSAPLFNYHFPSQSNTNLKTFSHTHKNLFAQNIFDSISCQLHSFFRPARNFFTRMAVGSVCVHPIAFSMGARGSKAMEILLFGRDGGRHLLSSCIGSASSTFTLPLTTFCSFLNLFRVATSR